LPPIKEFFMTASLVVDPELSPNADLEVTLAGVFDAKAGLALRQEIVDKAAAGPVLVLLGVSDVSAVTPSGLATLIDILRHVRARGGDVRLHGLSPAFDLAHSEMHLGDITRVYTTHREAARGEFRSRVSRRDRGTVTRRAGLRGHFGRRLGIARSN
jgi:anti-anti-sigma regulatory factor